MNIKLLKLLNRDSRTSVKDLSAMLGIPEADVRTEIEEMEREGIIRGYKAVIDWERFDDANVSAIIELKVTPKAGLRRSPPRSCAIPKSSRSISCRACTT